MAIRYVAYANGIRHDNLNEDDEALEVGADVNKADFDPEEWNYLVQHGAIVRKGGPHDPEVLAAANEPEEYDESDEDPRDTRIRQLEEALALYTGRGQTPAAGTHLSDLSDAESEEDVDEPRDEVADAPEHVE